MHARCLIQFAQQAFVSWIVAEVSNWHTFWSGKVHQWWKVVSVVSCWTSLPSPYSPVEDVAQCFSVFPAQKSSRSSFFAEQHLPNTIAFLNIVVTEKKRTDLLSTAIALLIRNKQTTAIWAKNKDSVRLWKGKNMFVIQNHVSECRPQNLTCPPWNDHVWGVLRFSFWQLRFQFQTVWHKTNSSLGLLC